MKLSFQWGNTLQTKKRVIRQPKIRWDLLGMADPAEEKKSVPIDEIRRRVVLMSNQSLACHSESATASTPEPSSDNRLPDKRTTDKPLRKARKAGSSKV
ncbi:MAG: hypothetical protein D6690_15995 [Nitrospirae bacterium]|nr:MAG: hypothetical protein D6690_15995 [Nitrospirota bacterium]